MNEMINERLKLISTAQENMVEVADTMDQWEKSQLIVEKSTFDNINISDKALNLSKECSHLISRFQECSKDISESLSTADKERASALILKAEGLLRKLLDIAYESSDVSHMLEREVACQREIAENMKNAIGQINASVNQAVACAEFLAADL